MKARIIKAIKEWAKKQERKQFMKLYGFDNKCPHCGEWQGNHGGVKGVVRDYPNKEHDAYKCGNCTRWFLMRADTVIQMVAADQRPAITLFINELQGDLK